MGIHPVATEVELPSEVIQFPVLSNRLRSASRRISFTEQRVSDLQGVGFVFDTKVAGLAVRMTSGGAKTYVFQRKIHGRPVRIALGKCAGMRLDAARVAVERLNGQVAAGVDPRSARIEARSADRAVTLSEAFESYKASKERRASTLLGYDTLWRLHVPSKLKTKSVLDLTAVDIEQLKAKLMCDRSGVQKADGTAGKLRTTGKVRTAGKVITLLCAILNKAGRRADNPTREIERPETKIRTRRLDVGEIAAVLKVLEERRGETFADLIAVALLTGARRGALCAMKWEDIHLEDGIWMVPATWSKNRRELAIALPEKAVAILAARSAVQSKSSWVWASLLSGTGHVVNPEKPLQAILKAAGAKRVSMHDLRRKLGSRLAMTGAGAATITAALGHISPQSAKAYTHIDVAHARAAMEKAINAS